VDEGLDRFDHDMVCLAERLGCKVAFACVNTIGFLSSAAYIE